MYKIFKLCVAFIYSHSFTNNNFYITATLNVVEPKIKKTYFFKNGFEPYKSLKEIRKVLRLFIGNKPKIVGNKIDIDYLNEMAKMASENYKHFEDAQTKIIELANELVYKGPYKYDNLYRIKRLNYLLKFNANLSRSVVIRKFISILHDFRIAYYILYFSKIRLLNPEFSQMFISSLAGILNEFHIVEYILFCGKSAIQELYIGQNQDALPSSSQSLKRLSFIGVVKNNHIIFHKLLIVVYQWQILLPIKRNLLTEYNPIMVGYRIVKDSKFLACNNDQTLAIILNDLLIYAFNQAGLEISDKRGSECLIFYCEKDNMIKGVELQDLIFLEYKGFFNVPGNHNKTSSSIDTSGIIDFLDYDLSISSKSVLTIQVINLILLGYEKIRYKEMSNIWISFSRKHMQCFKKSINNTILLFLSTKKSNFAEKYKEYYTKICLQTNYIIIWNLCMKYIENSMYSGSLNLIKDFYLISAFIKKSNQNILYIYENQLILLSKLLPTTIKDIEDEKFLSTAKEIFDNLFSRTTNICKQYAENKHKTNIKIIFAHVCSILTQGLKFFDLEIILRNIEDCLCNQELSLRPEFEYNEILKAINNISDFLRYAENKKDKISKVSDYNRIRIGNIVFKFFLILIDLEIILKDTNTENTSGKNLGLIIDYLAERQFNKLIFTQIASKPLVPANKAKNMYNMYFYFIEYLYTCNTIPNNRTHRVINMIFIDTLQIRMRLDLNFMRLTNSIPYHLLVKSDSRPGIDYNQEECPDAKGSDDTFDEEYNNKLLGEDIKSMFIICTKNNYELIIITLLDVLCTLRRLQYIKNINLSRMKNLDQEMKTLNLLLDNLDESINIFNEYSYILFVHVTIAIQYLCPFSNFTQSNVKDLKNSLNTSFFSIINKIHASFTKAKTSSAINFYIFLALSKVNSMHFENLESFNELKKRIKESQIEYFRSSAKKESMDMVWANILFSQLLSFLNINIAEKYKYKPITYPFIEDIDVYRSHYSVYNFTFTLAGTDNIYYKHPEFLNDAGEGFFNVFKNQIRHFPEICKFVLQVIIERLRLTENYNSDCLPYCYLLYSMILECNTNFKSEFINLDEILAKHIENCYLEDSYKSLCNIVRLHIKNLIYLDFPYAGEFLTSLTAVYDRSREMQWDHFSLGEY